MRVLALTLVSTAGLLAGCGPDCNTSCDKLFGDRNEECRIVVPGRSAQEMTNSCLAECEGALKVTGEMDGYDPDVRGSGAEDISLKNEQQAAAWMDCIAETSCKDLEDNYCAPTTNF